MKEVNYINKFIDENTKIISIESSMSCHDVIGFNYEFSPGNGLVYRIIVIPVTKLSFGIMGSIDPGFIVINGSNGKAHLFAPKGLLSLLYVDEKLYRAEGKMPSEAMIITSLIGFALDRETTIEHLDFVEFRISKKLVGS
jgi:hypothetical protein